MGDITINRDYLENLCLNAEKNGIGINIQFECNELLRELAYYAAKGRKTFTLTNYQKEIVSTDLPYVTNFFKQRDVSFEIVKQYAFPGTTNTVHKNICSEFYVIKF